MSAVEQQLQVTALQTDVLQLWNAHELAWFIRKSDRRLFSLAPDDSSDLAVTLRDADAYGYDLSWEVLDANYSLTRF